MSPTLRTVLLGAAIGACLGAGYAWVYVWLRQEAGEGFGALDRTDGLPDEPPAAERKRQASALHQQRTAAARAYREQHPGVTWPQALARVKADQNGVSEAREDVEAS